MKTKYGLGQAGDTLVEVLVCILIVSTILTGAYVTTNKSTVKVIDSQEHATALKLAQSQIEQIRQNATKPAPNVFNQAAGNQFCLVDTQIFAATEAVCKQDQAGAATATEPIYAVTAAYQACTDPGVPTGCKLFTVRVQWYSISSKTLAYQQVNYRLYN